MHQRISPWYPFVYASVLICTTLVGLALVFGPDRWVSSKSLQFVHDYLHIPWTAWGVAFLVFAVMLCNWRTRTLGYGLLATVGSLFIFCAVVYTTLPGDTTNVIVSGLSPLAALMLWAGARYGATADRLHRTTRAAQKRRDR